MSSNQQEKNKEIPPPSILKVPEEKKLDPVQELQQRLATVNEILANTEQKNLELNIDLKKKNMKISKEFSKEIKDFFNTISTLPRWRNEKFPLCAYENFAIGQYGEGRAALINTGCPPSLFPDHHKNFEYRQLRTKFDKEFADSKGSSNSKSRPGSRRSSFGKVIDFFLPTRKQEEPSGTFEEDSSTSLLDKNSKSKSKTNQGSRDEKEKKKEEEKRKEEEIMKKKEEEKRKEEEIMKKKEEEKRKEEEIMKKKEEKRKEKEIMKKKEEKRNEEEMMKKKQEEKMRGEQKDSDVVIEGFQGCELDSRDMSDSQISDINLTGDSKGVPHSRSEVIENLTVQVDHDPLINPNEQNDNKDVAFILCPPNVAAKNAALLAPGSNISVAW